MKWAAAGVVAILATGLSGCIFLTISSPAQYGLDVRVAPGFAVGSGGLTAHPTVAYARSVFGGYEGETDGTLHVGGQVRLAPGQEATGSASFWFGGEATYARRRTTFDLAGIGTESTSGWTLAALAGLPLIEGAAGTVHGYAAAGLNKYGGSGPYARVGIDLQPAFLRRR